MELLKEGIINSMPFPMWVFDNTTLRFLEVNDYALRRYGYSREEFLQMSLEDIRPSPEVERLYDHLQIKKDTVRRSPSYWQHQTKSGEVFWVKVRCQRFQNHQHYTAVLIEEEQDSSLKFKNLTDSDQLSYIVENSLDIFAVLDMQARFTFATKSLELCTGYSLESLMGTCAFDRIHEDDRKEVFEVFRQSLQEPHHAKRVTFRYEGADNRYRHFEAVGRAIIGVPELQGISIQARDITDRIQVEEALKQQNNKLKQIAWQQSHLVRAPLVNIMGLVNLMKKSENTSVEMEKYLKMLDHSAQKLDEAIHSLTELC